MYRTGYKPYENTDKNMNKTLKRFNRYVLNSWLLKLSLFVDQDKENESLQRTILLLILLSNQLLKRKF